MMQMKAKPLSAFSQLPREMNNDPHDRGPPWSHPCFKPLTTASFLIKTVQYKPLHLRTMRMITITTSQRKWRQREVRGRARGALFGLSTRVHAFHPPKKGSKWAPQRHSRSTPGRAQRSRPSVSVMQKGWAEGGRKGETERWRDGWVD